MAQLNSTNVTGNLSVTGTTVSSKIIKNSGTSDDILLGDGSVASLSQYAKTSDIPTATSQLTNDSGYITSSNIPTKLGSTTGGYLHCGNDGVTETGRYLDMHFAEADSLDFSTRLQCGGNHKNTVTLPSTSGTLATVSFSNGVLTITQ